MTDYRLFIGGEWIESHSGRHLDAVNPFNQEVWATVPEADPADVDRAVAAARRTFDQTWSKMSGLARAQMMNRLADLLDQHAHRMAVLESTDNGKVIRETENQMHFAARNYRFFAGYADKLYGEVIPLDNPALLDYTLREPVGVCALIIAWNSPMQLLANKLAPALAAGNTVVVKPSEHASVTTLEFAKLVEAAGFPAGVFNVVTGGPAVGDYLTRHPGVDKISFTGGPGTGRVIARNASENLVPVTLELGGKSPNIIFADANLPRAITGAVAGIFAASGQSCIAGSRLLVERAVYNQVMDELVRRARRIRLGNPLEPATEMGPVANQPQYERIVDRIQQGITEGARLVTGGTVKDPGLERGYFIAPTVFGDVAPEMTIAQEEIFGPVLSVIPFDTEDQAVSIANATNYGLAAGVWTENLSRAHRLARALKAGTVWVNTYRTSAAQAPFGGVKRSGYGRERGWHALAEYLVVKNVMIDLSQEDRDPFSIRT
jgi:acyl-CoA reductase-like NAD-dependent aldehyde dehydrogenase